LFELSTNIERRSLLFEDPLTSIEKLSLLGFDRGVLALSDSASDGEGGFHDDRHELSII
jgi:hypothetical protein